MINRAVNHQILSSALETGAFAFTTKNCLKVYEIHEKLRGVFYVVNSLLWKVKVTVF